MFQQQNQSQVARNFSTFTCAKDTESNCNWVRQERMGTESEGLDTNREGWVPRVRGWVAQMLSSVSPESGHTCCRLL